MTVGERIKQRRKELGLSADELAEKLNKNRATVYRYESSDIERIPAEVLKPLSEILQVSPEYLMGWSEEDEKNGLDRLVRDIEKDKNIKIEDVLQCSDTIPILNYTENGKMIFNEHLCLSDLHGDFCFKAADNSMSNSQIYAGAIVFIKKTDTIKNKDIVMISLNGKIFIRKYYYYTENQKLILYADNPDFEPMIFIGDEINNIKIIGIDIMSTVDNSLLPCFWQIRKFFHSFRIHSESHTKSNRDFAFFHFYHLIIIFYAKVLNIH